MQQLHFRSISELVIVCIVATALPFSIALTNAALKVSDLGHRAQHSVLEAANSIRDSESLSAELVSVERNARQYAVLGDPVIRDICLRREANALDLLTRLSRLDSDQVAIDQVGVIRTALASLNTALADGGAAALAKSLDRWPEVHAAADRIRQTIRESLDARLARLSEDTAETRSRLTMQSAVLAALGFVLAALSIVVIVRPVRQIDHAISRLGEEHYDDAIEVDGPRDLRQIGERLAWLGKRLGELDDLKNEFIRHVSHDLKTPLANIRESTELLLDGAAGEVSDAQREILEIQHKSGARLTKLIEDLLDFSEWQKQHVQLAPERVRLAALVDEAVHEQSLALSSRRLHLHVEVDPALEVTVDRRRLHTLFQNLLSNAIKYSPCGGRIELRAEVVDRALAIHVVDEGPGIPEAERELVFKPFYRSIEVRSKAIEGTGIGLALVEECVRAHGGRASFLPADRGAHFCARMPVLNEGENP